MIKCEPGDSVVLHIQLWDRATGLYPAAKIYSGSTLVTTVNLSHVASGYYQNTYTVDGTYKQLTIQYLIYTDAGRTTLANIVDYSTSSDIIYCNYDYRMSMGGVGGTTGLSKNDLELIKKLINEQIGELKEIIDKKSEFDPLKDKVKTDIEIPQFPNLREIKDMLSLVVEELKKPKKIEVRQKDYSKDIKNLDELVRAIKPTDTSMLEKKIDGIEKEAKFTESDLNKITVLLGKIQKANLKVQEDMLEAFNLEEDKRHKKLNQILMSIIYAIQNIKNQPVDFGNLGSELALAISQLKQNNE